MKIFNRRAHFDYELLKKFEAGIVLTGAEVKSVKEGHLKLEGSFVRLQKGEAWLLNAHIHPYRFADHHDYDPTRSRKLLLHQKELVELMEKSAQGLTLVPVVCYNKHGKVKLEIAVARGLKKYEKRELLKKLDLKRDLEKELRG